MKKLETKIFDKRTFKRNIACGLIKNEEFKTFLKSLPDCEGQYEKITFEDENLDELPSNDDLPING